MDTKLYLTIGAVAAILYALAFLLFPVNASLISSGSCNLRAKAGSPASSICCCAACVACGRSSSTPRTGRRRRRKCSRSDARRD